MEKPLWVFKNKTFFNVLNIEDNNYYFFSDFVHNWDLF
jgi:hypothetical protein